MLPENAPFTAEQRAWVNGFLAGLFSQSNSLSPSPSAAPSAAPVTRRPLLIAFGSQTGTAEGLARKLAKEAEQRGFQATVRELNAVAPADLTREERCLVVTSTWGDGDPPDNAARFWTQLEAESAPGLQQLQFAVLGLGDRNYSDFCGASKKFDERLAALGARRLLPRAECDLDYTATAQPWIESFWPVLTNPGGESNGLAPIVEPAVPSATPTPAPNGTAFPLAFDRTHPFPARLKMNRRLNRAGSHKDTRHFEISLEGSGLAYEVGDALGVRPSNHPALVEELLAALHFHGDEPVTAADGTTSSLHEVLSTERLLTTASSRLLREAATRGGPTDLQSLLIPSRQAELDTWLHGRDVLDVLRACPDARFTPSELAAHLRPLSPRLYSISSSPKAHPGEVHLTVAIVRYEAHGRSRQGVCSAWLADRVVTGETPVPVFVHKSPGFRLPADPATPVIMIGPGTGIAPFRAFLEERRVTGATGRNWLLFGDQRRACDFLYEEELTAWARDGSLTRLDLAFSRDQAEKIYVQTRMLEHAAEFWSWLEAGAQVYVCGDAKRMARDVDAALHSLISHASGRTADQAAEYVAALKTAKRYQRDVY